MKSLKKILIFSLAFVMVFSFVVLAEEFNGPDPTTFNQSPMWDKLVENGELPPVEERLPEDLYVVKPNESVGRYGGTIRTAGVKRWGGNTQLLMASPMFFKPSPDGTKLLPHLAKKYEVSDDKTTYTIYLRQGVNWSDGNPFTTEDIMFWYNDILLNKELTPSISIDYRIDGKVMEVKALDDYTFTIKFAKPYPVFMDLFYMNTSYWAFVAPKHYLVQFHAKYVDKEKLAQMTEDAGYDRWQDLFNNKYENHHGLTSNPDMPTLSGFRPVQWTSEKHVYERNPYYWKVDTEGNQLPYVDQIVYTRVSDIEIIAGMIMSGKIDFGGFNSNVQNFPMYKEYEDKGDYRTLLWQTGYGNQCVYQFPLTHKDPAMRKIFQDVRFRRAMSMAINRDEINNAIYFGKGEPAQYTLLPSSQYVEPGFATAYAEYNPEKAEALLDEMGLVDQDGDGWRDRPDGKKFTFTLEYFQTETPKTPNVELVMQHWQAVGIDARSKQISGELQDQRATGNLMDATLWHGGSAIDLRFPVDPRYIVPTNAGWERIVFSDWSRWYTSDGKEGEEPPAEIKQLHDWWDEMKTTVDESRRIELGKNILAEQADKIWAIGTIRLAPWPVLVDKNLHNVPETGLWCWSTLWTMSRDPEQFYFDENEGKNGNK